MQAMVKMWVLGLLSFAHLCCVSLGQAIPIELSPSERQRVEVALRSKGDFPTATTFTFTVSGPSEIPGYDKVNAHFTSTVSGSSGDLALLISKDGTRLAQFTSFDIASDPRTKVPSEGRPARGGPQTAPVLIVGFDDLECPFCARLNKVLFPALLDHYKDQVRIVYQHLPIEGHPWAMRAAVDTDCLGRDSVPAYWAAVDAIHNHAAEYGGTERKLVLAEQELDTETMEEGRRYHVDETKLKACVDKQDTTSEEASIAIAHSLGVTVTPTFFVNGARVEGAVPIEFIFDIVDGALRAEGQIPPARGNVSERSISK